MYKHHQAFTLYELLITCTLLGVLCSIAFPAFSALRLKSEQDATRNSLESAIHHARLQALIHRRGVELCAIPTANRCSTNWNNGWQSHFLGALGQPLNVQQRTSSTPVIWSGFSQSLRFQADGTSPISNGRFFQCHKGAVRWQLIINRQGRVRTANAAENQEQAYRCL